MVTGNRCEKKRDYEPEQRSHVHYSDSMSLVHITSFEGRVPCGELLNLSYNESFTFQGLDQMLLIMEDIMDIVEMPKAFLSHRYLSKEPYVFEHVDSDHQACVLDWRGMQAASGVRADFFIRCGFRQHGSMQGELTVLQNRHSQKIRFRSVLELMRMIYEQLERKE